jgi:DNA modification methylase
MTDLILPDATVLLGDCIERMSGLPDRSVQMCVTSPPYFGLRDYGVDGQIGLEKTPEQFIARLVDVFREVRRVIADDGTCWINIGDSYCSTAPGTRNAPQTKGSSDKPEQWANTRPKTPEGMKPKDLIGIPWMLAFALRADGWYLRQDIIWHKPNPMPESVRDRCTKSHEYIFLRSKSEKYFYDHEAVKESAVWQRENNPEWQHARAATNSKKHEANRNGKSGGFSSWSPEQGRNRRSVWTVSNRPYKGAHFAVFPPALVEPCILAGSRPGDVVLDPFNGSGTTGQVALQHGRQYVGIELNQEYVALTRVRLEGVLQAKAAACAPSPQSDLFAA